MRTLYILGVALLFSVVGPLDTAARAVEESSPPDGKQAETQFGIPVDKYTVERGQVSRHQTFADLLTPHGVSYTKAVQLARSVRSTFDVRDIQSGQSYRVYINPWVQRVQYLVYQIDAVRYVVFNVQNPSKSRVDRRTVKREWAVVEGTIENSLYEALTSNGAHPKLALQLSEVFAWQIDFFRIQSGDSFRILYEQRRVEGADVAPGKIIAACVRHQGERYFGFRFNDGDGAQYFDRRGQSLRRQLLKAPLRYSRISSGFTDSRLHPILDRRRPHHGTDYAAPTGTPVHSVGGGTVIKAGRYGANGNYVKIRHNETYSTGYLHLANFAEGIHAGVEVKQGETIGYVGSTGRSTGPHLDYRLWKHGTAVDPYEIDLPPSTPVNPKYRDAFQRIVEDRLDRLFPFRSVDTPEPVLSLSGFQPSSDETL